MNSAKQSEQDKRSDLDVRREMQMEALKHDLSTARTLKELVLAEIRNGVCLEWIAVKYGHLGANLERLRKFKDALDKLEEAKRERQEARQGSS